MLCDVCRERDATVTLTHAVKGEVNVLHLCQRCAGNARHRDVRYDAPEEHDRRLPAGGAGAGRGGAGRVDPVRVLLDVPGRLSRVGRVWGARAATRRSTRA